MTSTKAAWSWTRDKGRHGEEIVRRVRWLKYVRREWPALAPDYPLDHLLARRDEYSMISALERAWCRRWARESYRGNGAIVELGCFLGSGTLALARGLSENSTAPAASRTIHAFDSFEWINMADWVRRTSLDAQYRESGDFRALFDDEVRNSPVPIVVHAGDILDATWPVDAPIELLFNDLSKSRECWDKVRRTFLPRVPVGGTVLQQDFAHGGCPWLHVFHHRWRAHFTVVEAVPTSGSVEFRLDRELPAEAITSDVVFEDHGPEEIDAAFTWAADVVEPSVRANVLAAKAQWYALQSDFERATRAMLQAIAQEGWRGELASLAVPSIIERMDEDGLL